MSRPADSMSKVQKLTLLALLTAIVVVLQLLGSFIRFGGFSISLVLVPIVIGAALLGVGAGGWLGLVFGVTVLLSGDAALFLGFNAAGTIITVLGKGVLAGLAAGAVYRLIEGKNTLIATIAAAVVCPVVNTGVFFLGCYAFFYNAIAARASDSGKSVLSFIIFVFIGGNFIFELLFNVVLAPVIIRIVKIGKNLIANRKH